MSDDNIRIYDAYSEEEYKWHKGLAEHFKQLMREVLFEEGLIENDPNYNLEDE